jgi:hypothetical protein
MKKSVKKRVGRPAGRKAPHRPVLSARVPEEFYEEITRSARAAGRTLSEELVWRGRQAFEWEKARGTIQKWTEESRQALERGFEAALQEKGYLPIATDQGRIWLEPGMDTSRMSISVDAAAVVRAMVPDMTQILARALEKTTGKGGQS